MTLSLKGVGESGRPPTTRSIQVTNGAVPAIFHRTLQVPKMEESENLYFSCMDTAYVREFPHPQNSLK